jgi:glucose/mannose-6-phosphate isomerase
VSTPATAPPQAEADTGQPSGGVPAARGALDSDHMFEVTAGLPEQLAEAAAAARGIPGLPDRSDVHSVAVLGMGGSGVAGAVLAAAGHDLLPVPLMLVQDYVLPGCVGPGTLCFAVSFSGDTEETVAAARTALERGASLVAVTAGGELGRLAEEAGAPVYGVADGIPWPRAGIAAVSAPLLVACEEIGLLPGAAAAVAAAVDQLARRRDALVRADGGIAAEVARQIGRTVPLVYGAPPAGSVAAKRWKTQVNENTKAPAFYAVQPELCHNELCGWGLQGDVTRQVVTLVELETASDHPRTAARFEFVDEVVREAVSGIVRVTAEGDGTLAQLFDLVIVGDFVSLHLAAHEGVDPGPIPVLTDLKRYLRAI